MNKKLFLFPLILCSQAAIEVRAGTDCSTSSCKDCACKATSHTFNSIRPVFQVNSPEYLVHNRDFYKECSKGCGGTFQATVLGGKSTHNDDIAHFFLPFCKTTLVVNEQQLPGTDVLASHLNIYTRTGEFQSIVEFKPQHSYVGLGLNYQQKIYERCNGHSFWFSVSGPILQVHNRIEIVENIINNGGGVFITPAASSTPAVLEECPNSCDGKCCNLDPAQLLAPIGSVTAAFSQPGWCFGRIDNGTSKHKRETALGDLTARIGYETVRRDDCHLDSFIGAIVPTGNTPKAINVFEPIVGHNHHWGIVLGSTLGLEIWESECYDLTVSGEFDFMITTLFERTERRSFDLKYKPWSRYMQFYRDVDQAQLATTSTNPTYALMLHTPGIDILTQDLKVKPGYYRTFNAGFIIERRCMELEVGYNFFARQAECVRLDCEFLPGAALKAIDVGGGATGRFQTINNDFGNNCTSTSVANYNDNIITAADIDLESAAHPATLTHTMYGSIAYHFDTCKGYPMYLAAGGSYEFPPDNVGLNRWMAWGKFGVAF